MGIMDTLLKNSSSPFARELKNSFVTDNSDLNYPTDVPMMNVALSGSMDKGISSGITIFAGPSKHFKSLYSLKMLDAWFADKDPKDDYACLFYDTEYGITEDYLKQFPNIAKNLDKIVHIPVTSVEELRHESAKQVEALYDTYRDEYKKSPKTAKRPDVFILLDSIGQVASNKETDDAVNGKDTTDMTRAKAVKSFFRILTSKVKMLGIPMVVVAHTYQTLEMFSKAVVSGGTGPMYSADTVFIIGKSQDKPKDEILGYNFTLRTEKSRFIKEGSKFPITVHFEKGILKYSGFLDIAKACGFVTQCRVGRAGGWQFKLDDPVAFGFDPANEESYTFKSLSTEIDCDEKFWQTVMKYTNLKELIEAMYRIPTQSTEKELALVESVMNDDLAEFIND
jgi:hypothetical protein